MRYWNGEFSYFFLFYHLLCFQIALLNKANIDHIYKSFWLFSSEMWILSLLLKGKVGRPIWIVLIGQWLGEGSMILIAIVTFALGFIFAPNGRYRKTEWSGFDSEWMKSLIFLQKMEFSKNDLFSCNPSHILKRGKNISLRSVKKRTNDL